MPDNMLNNGQATNAEVDQEVSLSNSLSGGHSVAVKAPPTNKKLVFIGAKGKARASNGGFPLSPGESISLDISNALNIFFSVEEANDDLNWVVTGA